MSDRSVKAAKYLEWQDRLERQSVSGLSISAFCRQESISEGNVYFWKRKLKGDVRPGGRARDRVATVSKSRTESSPTSSANSGSPRFVQLPTASTNSPECVEVAVADGAVIRVPSENLAALKVVLDSLVGLRSGSDA